MNPYTKNIDRIEFVMTYACTGKCKHCSEGDHLSENTFIDGKMAAETVRKVCEKFKIKTVMTFGGEPLLRLNEVCMIHAEATAMGVSKRQVITNGFFTKDGNKIKNAAKKLSESGVNEILLSVDAFHQETIPLEPVMNFAEAVKNEKIYLKLSPAWLVSETDKNLYNIKTKELLKEFDSLNIEIGEGNIIFPYGNARKYLSEYFDLSKDYINPYEEDPKNVKTVSISPNGEVLDGNLYKNSIIEIIKSYKKSLE